MPRNEIKFSQYEAAYRAGLNHHDDPELGIAEASRKIRSTGIDPSTAVALIYNVSHLLRGEVYKRDMSEVITDAYLTWIRRDRGETAWANAIVSVEKHLAYLLQKRGARRHVLRGVLAKHKAQFLRPAESAIQLEWNDAISKGYFDILALDLFATEGLKKGIVHITRRMQGKDHQAKCDIKVHRLRAELDYEPYADFNEANGMFNGIARLKFADSDRTAIETVEWKPMGKATYRSKSFKSSQYSVPPAPPYTPPVQPAKKRIQMVRERPGQAKFRRDLKAAYNQRCCMTGCLVSETLDGAHIDSYKAPASDNLRNGLLLRRDIHALYDKHLIAIEPGTLVIHAAKTVRESPCYENLHGTKLTEPNDSSHRPDSGAIERRWNTFEQGRPKRVWLRKLMSRKAAPIIRTK